MLRAEGLTVERGGKAILADVTHDFAPGRITAICGPNGAGKSTLLRSMAGLLQPSSGTIALDNAPLASLSARERARRIGYLPQDGEVAWNLSLEALVALGRLPHGDRAPDKVAAAIEAVDLGLFADRGIATLSGGERACALLARVLAGEPGWILADEPLAALDIAHQHALLRHLRRAADAGAGVVLVLHDLALAANHADAAVVLDRGHLHVAGAPALALDEAVIGAVWGIHARWLGAPGAKALSIG